MHFSFLIDRNEILRGGYGIPHEEFNTQRLRLVVLGIIDHALTVKLMLMPTGLVSWKFLLLAIGTMGTIYKRIIIYYNIIIMLYYCEI